MKQTSFPLNYFQSMVTPKAAFYGRNQLSWFQIVIVFLFLNGLLMIPVSLFFANSKQFQLEEMMPNALQLIDDETMKSMEGVGFKNGEMQSSSKLLIEKESGVVGVNQPEKALKKEANVVAFEKNQFILKDQSGYEFNVAYTKDFDKTSSTTAKQLVDELKRMWYQQNRAFVSFTMMLMTGSILVVSNIVLIGGASIFVWLTKHNAYSSIASYRESVNFILNASGWGMLLGLVVGIVHFDLTIMLSLSSLGMVIMLTAAFVVTKFKDKKM
ncbi:DUF1189 domain-containing protein [Carnobacterium divergens]|uniref:DUF1189 domain-containing protein n=2 Tax=Carnobacterium divergens TaxID=2748 RepID=A0A7Z8D0R0_CARDV|nr:DUF1189 domain-containing protein [Carnobacterium divergens]TFI75051.1 DUF1189 domain-containing protein [Carnobacterium divergens]TFI79414.1 DUF1189 domain-containing protein [Carnobacterium divergens]TFI85746.1 DUF1189 domain-containing protein [Carnobacterium divergens]TFI98346.1 DUF1189 domain-containing protein [Carnobacterium divergens]TFJ14475.1 DUF1189 domain-containing protein [Carnobacterium divergens]